MCTCTQSLCMNDTIMLCILIAFFFLKSPRWFTDTIYMYTQHPGGEEVLLEQAGVCIADNDNTCTCTHMPCTCTCTCTVASSYMCMYFDQTKNKLMQLTHCVGLWLRCLFDFTLLSPLPPHIYTLQYIVVCLSILK